jgi:hypothetical protein
MGLVPCVFFLSVLAHTALGAAIFVGLLNFRVRVQKPTKHRNGNVAPRVKINDAVKENVTEKGHGDFVETAHNRVRGRPGSLDTIETGKVKKKAHKAGKDVLEGVIERVNVVRVGQQLDLTQYKGHGE